jgi:hypothetical protein
MRRLPLLLAVARLLGVGAASSAGSSPKLAQRFLLATAPFGHGTLSIGGRSEEKLFTTPHAEYVNSLDGD